MDSDHIAMTETLSYAGFVEALGRIALIALDKPAFERLYPSAVDKVPLRALSPLRCTRLCRLRSFEAFPPPTSA